MLAYLAWPQLPHLALRAATHEHAVACMYMHVWAAPGATFALSPDPPYPPPPPPALLLTMQALIDSVSAPDALANEHAVRSIAFFDHEEVGSDSAQGAGGPVMRDTITRVARLLAQVRPATQQQHHCNITGALQQHGSNTASVQKTIRGQ